MGADSMRNPNAQLNPITSEFFGAVCQAHHVPQNLDLS